MTVREYIFFNVVVFSIILIKRKRFSTEARLWTLILGRGSRRSGTQGTATLSPALVSTGTHRACINMYHVDKWINQWKESVVRRPRNQTSLSSVILCSLINYSNFRSLRFNRLFRIAFLKLKCVYASPGDPVTIQIMTQWVWGWA